MATIDERTGTIFWPTTVPSTPRKKLSMRRTCGLYDAYTCVMSPSLCSIGMLVLTLAPK